MNDSSPSSSEDDRLRNEIADALGAGLQTDVWPRAETSEMVNEVVAQLGSLSTQQVQRKLVLAGFTDHTIEADGIEQPCETCMYYLTHRKFCDLPELMLPVEPQWSCKLWRI